jgi:hypothetical protein
MVTQKYLSGGEIKGPASRPASNSLFNFESTAIANCGLQMIIQIKNQIKNQTLNYQQDAAHSHLIKVLV